MSRRITCSACGSEHASSAWICACGQDLREPDATLGDKRPFRAPVRHPSAPWLALPGGVVLGGCLGMLVGASGSSSWLGSSFDVTLYGIVGGVAGLLLGVGAAVGWWAARRRRGRSR